MYHLLTENELKLAYRKEFKKNDILFREGELCEYAGIVETGELLIASRGQDGKDVIYNIVKAGNIFGNNLLFSKDKSYRGDVIARSDGALYLFKKEDLLVILEGNRSFHQFYLEEQAETIKRMNLTIRLLSFESSDERLLLMLGSRHGALVYRSITELARELHLSRESLSRTITRLEKIGRITRLPHKLLLNQKQ